MTQNASNNAAEMIYADVKSAYTKGYYRQINVTREHETDACTGDRNGGREFQYRRRGKENNYWTRRKARAEYTSDSYTRCMSRWGVHCRGKM